MAAYIEPRGVARKVELEYSSRVLGRILTMSPRAPGPLTSSTWPFSSVKTQCRDMSCTGCAPSLLTSMLYVNWYSPSFSSRVLYAERTKTVTPASPSSPTCRVLVMLSGWTAWPHLISLGAADGASSRISSGCISTYGRGAGGAGDDLVSGVMKLSITRLPS